MSGQAPKAYELTIVVQPADVDQLGHVNNVTYVRWVQDVAVAHWRAVAPQDDQQKLLWIVLRHEIDYKHPALPGEILTIRTWVGNATRFKFDRHTEFVRASDGKLIAKARTVWCPIDAFTGKPVEVGDDLRAKFSSE